MLNSNMICKNIAVMHNKHMWQAHETYIMHIWPTMSKYFVYMAYTHTYSVLYLMVTIFTKSQFYLRRNFICVGRNNNEVPYLLQNLYQHFYQFQYVIVLSFCQHFYHTFFLSVFMFLYARVFIYKFPTAASKFSNFFIRERGYFY